jgi:aminoglycoside phosphotransferase (APT) family kinase protein
VTSREWEAEHVVGPDRASALVEAQFPLLRGLRVEPMAEGWDNTVHVVGREWVFRFPRRAMALPGVRREIAVLPRVASRLPLPVPLPELVGEPTDGYPWPFWGARLLPGTELADAGVPDRDRVELGRRTGQFLHVLHSPALTALAGDLPVDPMRRADAVLRAAMADEWLGRLRRRGLPAGIGGMDDLLVEGARLGPPAGEARLAHGDLHVRHLLVDDRGAAAAVIDWGDVCLADPAVDLALAYAAFAGAARAALLDAYGDVPPEQELRARVLAVCLSAVLAEYAAADGRDALLAEALAGLRRAVA